MDFSGIVPALPSLWEGMLMTLKLMVLGVLGGVALGTVLALMRLSHSKLLSNIAGFYVNYFRSIPLLLVITWFYFAVPFILRWITGEDTPVGAFTSCLVAFMMFEAAYYCEIVRAGIQAIPKGQMGAAQALGMTYGQHHAPGDPAAGVPQDDPAAAATEHHPVPGHLAGLYRRPDGLPSIRPVSRGDIIGQANEFLIFAGLVYFVVSFTASFAVKRLQKRLTV